MGKCNNLVQRTYTTRARVKDPFPNKMTAAEWNQNNHEFIVCDPDGWPRHDGRKFNRLWFHTLMDWDEFDKRARTSSTRPNPLYHKIRRPWEFYPPWCVIHNEFNMCGFSCRRQQQQQQQ